ncbi:hypothetical protein [Mesorhizobium sp. KR1-2]
MNAPSDDLARLQEMHNGKKIVPTFGKAEMKRRQDGLRRNLA